MLKRAGILSGLGLLIVYVRGLMLDVMDVDASQYAAISLELLRSDNWLHFYYRGDEYLDKPPLLFWLSATAFKIFGVSNWAYKLPSFAVAIWGVYAVYRFGRLYYSERVAAHAAWMLAASLGLVVACNDVRTDTMLLGFTAAACWMLAEYVESRRMGWLLGAFVQIGLAMLAKGPIGLVAPAFALGAHLLLRRDWRMLFNPRWALGLATAALLLAPMCWGLYTQFDLHPEKVVNERTGVSGLHFYFWEQSFGRVTGENIWKNDAGPFYFVHVILWAFLPWSLLLPPALWARLRALVRQRMRLSAGAEGFSIGGFVLTFVALSQSQYKLPHYIFIVLPWAALLSAAWLEGALSGRARAWAALQTSVAALVVISAAALFWIFPARGWLIPAVWALLVGVWIAWSLRRGERSDSRHFVAAGVLGALGCFFVLNFHFYARLLPYQNSSAAAQYARERGIADRLVIFNHQGNAMDFYARRIVPMDSDPESLLRRAREQGGVWVYGDGQCKAALEAAGAPIMEVVPFRHFQAALLTLPFLNPRTRDSALRERFLIYVAPSATR